MDSRSRPIGTGDTPLLPRAQRLLLALIAHSPVCIIDCKRLWDCLASADPCVKAADFALTLTDLVARGLAEVNEGQRLSITAIGKALLEDEEEAERWR